ncbi:MAG: permease-like cell division protein FtsX [Fusobacteriaceae bacterium]|nr:permease-like cell division protein FtsX [Fusobacteriaceae bacterium]
MEIDLLQFGNKKAGKAKPVVLEEEEEQTAESGPRIELGRCTVVPFLIVFFFLNVIVASVLNFYAIAQKIEKNHFFSVDLRPNLTATEKEALEKRILEVPGVKNVRYVSRAASFRDLQTQLGIALPESENSLSDSMIIYLRSKKDLANLQERLENMEDVKETYVDLINIQYREDRAKFYKVNIVMFFGVFFLPLVILTLFIFYNGFSLEFLNKYPIFEDERRARKRAKWINVLPMVVCAVIATLAFLNLYLFFGELLTSINETYKILSLKELLIPQIIVAAGICLLIILLPFWPYKRYVGDET